MNTLKILLTEDGSHTLENSVLKEQYHSKHGAIQESKHIFIKNGFEVIAQKKDTVNILEIGFGTGLNAYLTALENKNQEKTIFYTAVEAFPISIEAARQLNYPKLLTNKNQDSLFDYIHNSDWEVEHLILSNFKLKKQHALFQHLELKGQYDLIYFDAFSPACQPELWTVELFAKLFSCLTKGGIFVTYCAKGEVKRALKKVGFEVHGLPGPPGKREMTAACKLV